MKYLHLSLVLLFILGCSGCATQGNTQECAPAAVFLPEGPSAADYLEQALKDHRLVFLSERHADVAPIIFLTDNLERLHRAGLRILFLEGMLPELQGTAEYRFYMFYPWIQAGWKYETQLLAERLEALNAVLPAEEKIKVVSPEEGVPSPQSGDPETLASHMNLRDSTAAGRIKQEMDRLSPDSRGLIFYGGSHGYIHPQPALQAAQFPEKKLETWISLGARLAEHYLQDFFSMDAVSMDFLFRDGDLENWQDPSGDGTRGLDSAVLKTYIKSLPLTGQFNPQSLIEKYQGYHGTVLLPREVYGRMYQYVPTKANLDFIRGRLENYSRHFNQIKEDVSGFRFRAKGQFSLGIYTLRLWFGDQFDYDLWNPRQSLSAALEQLAAQKDPGPPAGAPSAAMMQAFHRHMRLSRLEVWLTAREQRFFRPLLEHLPRAVEAFPQDAWARYWLAVVLTESGRPFEALPQWEALLDMPLSRSLETYPEALDTAAKCAGKTGRADLEQKWRTLAVELRTEGNLSFKELEDTHGSR